MLITDIRQRDWSLSTVNQGDIVQGLDDISQCIYIIVTTAKGSDPLRPEFGCDIRQYLDKPTTSVPDIIREVTRAIEIWETRVELTKVQAQLDISTVNLKIEWKTADNYTGITNVSI